VSSPEPGNGSQLCRFLSFHTHVLTGWQLSHNSSWLQLTHDGSCPSCSSSAPYIPSAWTAQKTLFPTISPLPSHVFIITETCLSSCCLAAANSFVSTVHAFSHYVTKSSKVGNMEYSITYNCNSGLDFLS
jgi:hypothetical protein